MKLNLEKLLHSQGIASRKDCFRMIRKGRICVDGSIEKNASLLVDPMQQEVQVDGEVLAFQSKILLAINKPSGVECTKESKEYRSIFAWFPEQWVRRGLQCCGRLDADSEGLVLFTDDGNWNHSISHPNKGLIKKYRVRLKHPFSVEQKERLLAGVELRNEKGIYIAGNLEELSENEIAFTITTGIYHQVKRMVAAAGNRVEYLERYAIGPVELSEDWERGQYRMLDPAIFGLTE
jgi:16S rRNA pseudouridine516 synthase